MYKMSVRSLRSIKSCVCKDNIKCKYIVVSSSTLFHRIYKKCVNVQLSMYGCDGVKKNTYIYLNNFNIFIDTVFRMLVMFKKEFKKLREKFDFSKMILINDLHETPKKWYMWNYLTRTKANDDFIFKCAIHKLKTLSKLLDDDEMYDYDSWEEFLSQTYKGDYDFSLHYPPYKISNFYKKQNVIKKFVYLISLTQMQLSQNEILEAWKYVLNVVSKNKNVKVFCCENGEFDFNICHIFNSQRTVFITKNYVCTENIFFYDFDRVFYPAGSKIVNKFIPNNDAKLLKYERDNKKLIDYFKMCEDECHGKILDINDFMTMEIFRDLNSTYVKNVINVVKPNKFSEDEYMWVTVDLYESFLPEVLRVFGRIFEFNLC